MKRFPVWAIWGAVAAAILYLRFHDLGRSAVRADELNFLNYARAGQSVMQLWLKPPWLNQIPFADSIAIVWHWIRSAEPNEATVREPFAILGSATVLGVAAWLARRRGIAAGVLVGLWMGFLPFHVYESREAYYYVVVMAVSGGMTLYSADLLVKLRAGQALPRRVYAMWTTWVLLACLTHMSTWVVATVCWLLLLGQGIALCTETTRKNHVLAMIWSAAVIGLVMVRWIWRAVTEMQRVSQSGGHLGGEFDWVAPRVLLFFTSGANTFGAVGVILLVAAGVYAMAMNVRRDWQHRDHLYDAVSAIMGLGFVAVYTYVAFVGGGVAKVTYFSVLLPVFLVWAAYTLDTIVATLPGRWATVMRVAMPCAVVVVLARPAWMVTQLEGKPVPYKKIRDWLDENLEAGSVVVIDRWFEPWNEMALYAPKNVTVTFTVPDDPFETYKQLRWREVTQQSIEQGKDQGFIRLTRNHEASDGLWVWPETHFARRGKIVNDVGLWLREHGYVATGDFYASNKNRLVTEIFYDLREDALARKRQAGEKFAVFFNPSMRYAKTGPIRIFPFLTQEFMDWRMLEETGTVDIFNLTDTQQSVRLKVRGVSPRGPKTLTGPNGERVEFGRDDLEEAFIGPVDLEPGDNTISFTDPNWDKEQRPLLIADVEIMTDP